MFFFPPQLNHANQSYHVNTLAHHSSTKSNCAKHYEIWITENTKNLLSIKKKKDLWTNHVTLLEWLIIFFTNKCTVMLIEWHYMTTIHIIKVQTFMIVLELIIGICSNHNKTVPMMVLQVVEEWLWN